MINQRNKEIQIKLPAEAKGALSVYVDVTTGENPPAQIRLADNAITLKPFSVQVLQFN